MDIKEFLQTYHLPIFKEYERSQLSWDELKVGSIVVTLRTGFGGGPAQIREVIKKEHDQCGNRATLSNLTPDGSTYGLTDLHSLILFLGHHFLEKFPHNFNPYFEMKSS
jgi:hypothetical protein